MSLQPAIQDMLWSSVYLAKMEASKHCWTFSEDNYCFYFWHVPLMRTGVCKVFICFLGRYSYSYDPRQPIGKKLISIVNLITNQSSAGTDMKCESMKRASTVICPGLCEGRRRSGTCHGQFFLHKQFVPTQNLQVTLLCSRDEVCSVSHFFWLLKTKQKALCCLYQNVTVLSPGFCHCAVSVKWIVGTG